MKNINILKLGMIASASMLSFNAFAASGTSSIHVQADIKPGCVISANDIVFGELKSAKLNTANTTITLQCSTSTNVRVSNSSLHGDTAGTGASYMLLNNDVANKNDNLRRVQYTLQVMQPSDKTNINFNGPDSGTFADLGSRSHFSILYYKTRVVAVPIVANISASYVPYTKVLGNYTDTATFTAIF